MHSPGINGEGELRGQQANPGSPGKMAVKNRVCVKRSVYIINENSNKSKLLSCVGRLCNAADG